MPHLGLTAGVALLVLVGLAVALRSLGRSWRTATVRHELHLTRQFMYAGLIEDARIAHRRAQDAHRAGVPLDDLDTELLAVGPPLLLLETQQP